MTLLFWIYYILCTHCFFYLEFSFLMDHFVRVWFISFLKYHLLRNAFLDFPFWNVSLSSHCLLPSISLIFIFNIFNIFIFKHIFVCLLSISSTCLLIFSMTEILSFLFIAMIQIIGQTLVLTQKREEMSSATSEWRIHARTKGRDMKGKSFLLSLRVNRVGKNEKNVICPYSPRDDTK